MDDDDDFTFPTAVAATTVEEERGDVDGGTVAMLSAARLGDDNKLFPLPGSAAPGGVSRLWPFAALLIGATTTTTAAAAVKEGEKEAPASTRREEKERAAVVDDDEDRMDMLWDDTAAAAPTTASARKGGRAAPEHPAAAAKPAEKADDERAAAVAEQEKMDLLWESFNEELLLRRARSTGKHVIGAALGPPEPDWYHLCPSSTSDAESEETSAVSSSPGRPRYGCAPTMLRASSRAGGAGQFYSGSPCQSRSRRGRGGGWALLLRLFRRLFTVDNAAPRRHSIYVP